MNSVVFKRVCTQGELSTYKPCIGEIAYCADTNTVYVCATAGLWMQMPDYPNHDLVERKQIPRNCKNCGAVLTSHQCEYCGTQY